METYRATPPIRKVKEEATAKEMIQIADDMLIAADYTFNGRWYVVAFHCSDYEFMFLRRTLKKKLKK